MWKKSDWFDWYSYQIYWPIESNVLVLLYYQISFGIGVESKTLGQMELKKKYAHNLYAKVYCAKKTYWQDNRIPFSFLFYWKSIWFYRLWALQSHRSYVQLSCTHTQLRSRHLVLICDVCKKKRKKHTRRSIGMLYTTEAEEKEKT